LLKYIFITSILSFSLFSAKPKANEETVKAYEPPPEKEPTKKEIQQICKKYRSSYISFAGEDFYVNKKCQRQKIIDTAALTRNKKTTLIEVNSLVIKALKSVPQKKQSFSQKEKKRILKKYRGRCLTHSEIIYQIKDGYKKAFPDWPSYKKSRCKKLEYVESDFLEIFPEGESFPSILDKEQPQLVFEDIENFSRKSDQKKCLKRPKKELVSYFSKVYKKTINKKGVCFYRILDDQNTKSRLLIANSKIAILSDKDYLSLPFEITQKKHE
jgi:hypothetical protein